MATIYGVMQIGRLPLREDDRAAFTVADEDGLFTLQISGQESVDRLGMALVEKRMDDIASMSGQIVPVSFTHKVELNGFYRVSEVSGTYVKWVPNPVGIVPWQLTLTRLGYPSEVDIESRLSGPLTRVNDFSGIGKRWHAPARNHTSYSAGSTTPLFVTRTGSDGAMVVYTNVTVGINPRWASTVTNYLLGRCQFLDSAGVERSAVQMPLSATGWT